VRRRVDGLILTTARINTPIPLGQANPSLPHVLALRTNDTSFALLGDDRLGAHLATRHLLDLGHRRIGLVRGPSYASTARNREAGYRDALTEAGVPVDETLLDGDSFTMQSGEIAGRKLLDRPDRPTAIFAVNDNNAIGVMAAAHALGLRVPDDLSLVGYNDIPVVSRLPFRSPPSACRSRRSPRTPWSSSATPATTTHPAPSSPHRPHPTQVGNTTPMTASPTGGEPI
jgi:LacI family transcriptional regulator